MPLTKYFAKIDGIPPEELLTRACQFLVQEYSLNGKITIVKSFGKRQEYVTGYGEEQVLPIYALPLIGRYMVLIQSDKEPDEEFKKFIQAFLIIHIKLLEERRAHEH